MSKYYTGIDKQPLRRLKPKYYNTQPQKHKHYDTNPT